MTVSPMRRSWIFTHPVGVRTGVPFWHIFPTPRLPINASIRISPGGPAAADPMNSSQVGEGQ